MTDPTASRHAGHAPVETEVRLQQLETRLVAEFACSGIGEDIVRQHLSDLRTRFADARVQAFVPILIERAIRRRLSTPAGLSYRRATSSDSRRETDPGS
jgi:hypothetical protein